MGLSTVDLPDPIETPAPVSTAGADDLLAQLASEEVDRLLAESAESRPSVDFAAAQAAPPIVAPDARATQTRAAADAAMGASPFDAAVAAQLDEVFDQQTQPQDTAIAPAPLPPVNPLPPAAVDLPDAGVAALFEEISQTDARTNALEPSDATAAAAPVEQEQTTGAERAALAAPVANGVSPVAPATPDTPDGASSADPLLIRILEMLNRPLAHQPPALRQALGKIALLTLLNALAILIYVLFVRR